MVLVNRSHHLSFRLSGRPEHGVCRHVIENPTGRVSLEQGVRNSGQQEIALNDQMVELRVDHTLGQIGKYEPSHHVAREFYSAHLVEPSSHLC